MPLRRTIAAGSARADQRGRFRHQPAHRRAAPRTARLVAAAATVTALTGVTIGAVTDRVSHRAVGTLTSPIMIDGSADPTPTPRAGTTAPPAPRSGEPTAPPETPPETAPTIPDSGSGRFGLAAVAPPEPVGAGRRLHYTVEVEHGLPYDPDDIATTVDATLADSRGWTATDDVSFERVTTDEDVRVLIATPDTTDALCAPLRTGGEVSCRNGTNVVVNAKRWAHGVPHYDGDLGAYRQYVINHEIGHAIGNGHEPCPASGEAAPVMQQQTYGLDGCRANPWPYP